MLHPRAKVHEAHPTPYPLHHLAPPSRNPPPPHPSIHPSIRIHAPPHFLRRQCIMPFCRGNGDNGPRTSCWKVIILMSTRPAATTNGETLSERRLPSVRGISLSLLAWLLQPRFCPPTTTVVSLPFPFALHPSFLPSFLPSYLSKLAWCAWKGLVVSLLDADCEGQYRCREPFPRYRDKSCRNTRRDCLLVDE